MQSEELQKYVSLAIKIILVLSIFTTINKHLWHLTSTSILLLILMFAPQIIKKYKLKIPPQFEWLLLIFVAFILFLGETGGIITPIFFGISIGFIGFLILAILYSNNSIKRNPLLIMVFSFNFVVTFGFLIELAKYYLKTILNQSISQGTYTFTMTNMTYVILGALISSIIGYIYMKEKVKIVIKIVEKFKKINPKVFKKEPSKKEIVDLIQKGENKKSEFKASLRVNLHTNEIDKNIEYTNLKTIVAFLNSEAGDLLIGVSNKGEILGIEKDRFGSTDKFLLHLINIIKEKIGKNYLHLINCYPISIKGKTIIKVECKKSNKPVFLHPTPQEEFFYIRTGPATTQIKGSVLVDYINRNFKKN